MAVLVVILQLDKLGTSTSFYDNSPIQRFDYLVTRVSRSLSLSKPYDTNNSYSSLPEVSNLMFISPEKLVNQPRPEKKLFPIAMSTEVSASSSSIRFPNLVYHGGLMMTSVSIVPLFVDFTTFQSQIMAFYTAFVTSNVVWSMREYNTAMYTIGLGSVGPAVSVASSEISSTVGFVSDQEIQDYLTQQIFNGSLPIPTGNTLFALHFPYSVTVFAPDGSASGSGYCAYHSNFFLDLNSTVVSVAYMVLPEPDKARYGCHLSARPLFESYTAIASHEIIESITDPDGDAWYDDMTGEEIGDICAWQVASAILSDGQSYLLQKEWSNAQKSCINPLVSAQPSVAPTSTPSSPSRTPSTAPSYSPTAPTASPTKRPRPPTTTALTAVPTGRPRPPTTPPSRRPLIVSQPSRRPSQRPSNQPSPRLSRNPTKSPLSRGPPTKRPTTVPTPNPAPSTSSKVKFHN